MARICSQSTPSRGKTERMGEKGLMFLVTVTQSLKQGRGDKSKSEAKFAGGWLMADIPMLTQGLSVTVGVFFFFFLILIFYSFLYRYFEAITRRDELFLRQRDDSYLCVCRGACSAGEIFHTADLVSSCFRRLYPRSASLLCKSTSCLGSTSIAQPGRSLEPTSPNRIKALR